MWDTVTITVGATVGVVMVVVVFMVEDTAEAVTEEVVLEEAEEVTDVVKSSRHPQKRKLIGLSLKNLEAVNNLARVAISASL